MTSKLLNKLLFKNIHSIRNYARTVNPFKKTVDILANDMPSILSEKTNTFSYPEHADIVIIGGGHIGAAAAYWLKVRAGEGLSIAILEKDFTYEKAQKNISKGTITQHFSLPENVHLSKYSMEFLRTAKESLNKDCELQYNPTGSLVLASEKYAQKLEENVLMMNELGVKNQILTTSDINNKFPWIDTNDIKLGGMAVEGEGTFNSWALLKGLIQKSKELGATYVNAEVTGFEVERQKDVLMEGITPGTFKRINKVVYKTENNEEYAIKFAICILAAGSDSGQLATLTGIGKGEDMLKVSLPVEKRECDVYSIQEKATATGLCTPLVMDTTGLWLMRSGLENNLLCGNLPMMTDDTKDNQDYFNNVIKPSIINRFPFCKDAEIRKYTKETHNCNIFDYSGIVGPHPYHNNLYLATGFGRQGCQHAPGIGRAIAELVIDSQYVTVDLTRFSFDRFLMNEPVVDFNVY